MRYGLFLLILCCLFFRCHSKELHLVFYNQKLTIEYDETIVLKKKLRANEKDLKKFYEDITKSRYQSVLNALQLHKSELQLNDWLYYMLIDKFCESIDNRVVNASYLKWFILGKSDYRCKITFVKDNPLIWLDLGDLPIVGLRKMGESYCINCKDLDFKTHELSRVNPFQNNKLRFSLLFNPLPVFPFITYSDKIFRLRLPDSSYKEVLVRFNNELLSCQKDFDGFNMQQVFSVPLSKGTSELISEISEIVKNYSDSAKVEYITSFTRQVSKYKPDQDYFGKEKWMTPEEYLFYDSGDCDDRSSFLYYALKNIVKKPIVVIDYPNIPHVNIGVNLELKMKPSFFYKGKPYYVVEPTALFGLIPLGTDNTFMETKYKIIGE